MSSRKLWFGWVAVVSTMSSTVAHADEPTTTPTFGKHYRIQRGDTCVSITTRAYGDRAQIDGFHQGNPQLGALPHKLTAGQTVFIPFPAATGAPDAKLRAVRNDVRIEAANPKRGEVNDPLYRGNRIATEKRSGADLLFRDESQLRMGEQTLVVILGDTKSRTQKSAGETTLVSGELSSKLGSLTKIATEGASAELAGEGRVSVDANKATRVSSLKGSATVTAQKRKVQVQEGFGSKVELGKPPTPPRPLPPPPVWSSALPSMLLTLSGTSTKAVGELEPAPSNIAGVRVQIASDANFEDLISDVFVSKEVRRIEAEALTAGVYYLRLASVDDDSFVGQYGATVSTQVVALRQGEDGSLISDDARVTCTTLDEEQVRKTRCVSSDGARSGEVERALPAKEEPVIETPNDAVILPLERRDRGFELGIGLGLGFGWNTTQLGPRGEVGAAYAFGLGPGTLVLGGALGFEGYPTDRRGGLRSGGETLGGRSSSSHLDFVLGVPVSYRFGDRRARLVPVVQLRPELLIQSGKVNDTSASAALFAVRGMLGTQLTFGSWGLEVLGGYRLSTANASGSAPFRGASFSLGFVKFF